MKLKNLTFILGLLVFMAACSEEVVEPDDNNGNGNVPPADNYDPTGGALWTIPNDEVFDGGPGKDGIPALENPELLNINQINYLVDDDLVIGFKVGNDIRAYPHKILDWHEIINDDIGTETVAITYCPLTGTGIGWDRMIDGEKTTFGVSGLLYNSNLIPYDRKTDSNWSQILMQCVNGNLVSTRPAVHFLVETTWKEWKTMFPNSKVVSRNTGFSRDYNRYPYGDYKTNNNNIIFPINPMDNRLPTKERVHAIVADDFLAAKAYRFASFNGLTVIEDNFDGKEIVVVGDDTRNFIVSYERELSDGTLLNFTAVPNGNATVLFDNEGNQWNIFGEAVSGNRMGQKLTQLNAFMGYWFSIGAFYPNTEIYE